MKINTFRPLDTIAAALDDIRQGKMVIVVDDEDRENEGDFIIPADMVTPEIINFMATVGRGLICTPLSEELAKKFDLPLQVQTNTASLGTAFTVTIDAKNNIATGISAADRSHTIKLLTQNSTTAQDFVRPGHIFPLIAKAGGVLERPGHTEAAVDLARLTGCSPVGVICEIMNPDGSMARFDDLCDLADKHQLKMISIADLINYRKSQEQLISLVETIPFPTKHGEFKLAVFQSEILKQEHVVLFKGLPLVNENSETLVRIHSECLTGDVFGSQRCDCGEQLEQAMAKIAEQDSGIIIYLKQEGRGIGLLNKIKAYQLQDQGRDTAEANLDLGFPVDMRDYTMAAQILKYFGIKQVHLLTNNPDKINALKKLGLESVIRKPIEVNSRNTNHHYLLTKKLKLGHLLSQNFNSH